MNKIMFFVFLILSIFVALDVGNKLRKKEHKLQYKELAMILICVVGLIVSSVVPAPNQEEEEVKPSTTQTVQKTPQKSDDEGSGPKFEMNTNGPDLSQENPENAIAEHEEMETKIKEFFANYSDSCDMGIYYVCNGKYDIICDMTKSKKSAEGILNDMTLFIAENGYRNHVMSITLNVAQTNGGKNIVVVEDFSSEVLPYVGYSLYKNGVVTETTLAVDKDKLLNAVAR